MNIHLYTNVIKKSVLLLIIPNIQPACHTTTYALKMCNKDSNKILLSVCFCLSSYHRYHTSS